MLDLRREFSQLMSDFPQFRAWVVKAQQQTGDEAIRAQLTEMLGNLDEAFEQTRTTFPAALDQLEREERELAELVEKTGQEAAELQAELDRSEAAAASAAAQATPPPKPGVKIDPNFAVDLSADLLRKHGYPVPQDDRHRYGDFWDHWRQEHRR